MKVDMDDAIAVIERLAYMWELNMAQRAKIAANLMWDGFKDDPISILDGKLDKIERKLHKFGKEYDKLATAMCDDDV